MALLLRGLELLLTSRPAIVIRLASLPLMKTSLGMPSTLYFEESMAHRLSLNGIASHASDAVIVERTSDSRRRFF